jgi:hypothetical protein
MMERPAPFNSKKPILPFIGKSYDAAISLSTENGMRKNKTHGETLFFKFRCLMLYFLSQLLPRQTDHGRTL